MIAFLCPEADLGIAIIGLGLADIWLLFVIKSSSDWVIPRDGQLLDSVVWLCLEVLSNLQFCDSVVVSGPDPWA